MAQQFARGQTSHSLLDTGGSTFYSAALLSDHDFFHIVCRTTKAPIMHVLDERLWLHSVHTLHTILSHSGRPKGELIQWGCRGSAWQFVHGTLYSMPRAYITAIVDASCPCYVLRKRWESFALHICQFTILVCTGVSDCATNHQCSVMVWFGLVCPAVSRRHVASPSRSLLRARGRGSSRRQHGAGWCARVGGGAALSPSPVPPIPLPLVLLSLVLMNHGRRGCSRRVPCHDGARCRPLCGALHPRRPPRWLHLQVSPAISDGGFRPA